MTLDRTKASRLLAKCAAYLECGKPETARTYALQLMAYLGECIDGDVSDMTAHINAVESASAPTKAGGL